MPPAPPFKRQLLEKALKPFQGALSARADPNQEASRCCHHQPPPHPCANILPSLPQPSLSVHTSQQAGRQAAGLVGANGLSSLSFGLFQLPAEVSLSLSQEPSILS